ncbi:tRNA lysidine(34) synthetase TilS [Filibacter tadaridae]|uniref:tRNA(Ile)-lysidine synthase n=1 Tax=Filibacter tadaridae TaxID=2483811 RepID=A0A3P5WC78_9BACL|nr:tRNA lysidine(34) synthetase TilS [Filibacter tadaridae]VDC18877.1 tRNA(Ile)-lysidine synthase [Filibacter tadaridae]
MDRLVQDVLQFSTKWSLVAPGDRLLIACSGGVDSIALLHFMASERERMKIELAAVHVDHMLRGEESAIDGDLVEQLCETLGIPFFGGSVPVPAIVAEEGGNIQAVCREERYAYFSTIMNRYGYHVLATAHHAEDQLETMMMQLTKGTRPSGMPVKRNMDGGKLIRPFLPAMKADLYSYVKENDLQFREDPSNQSEKYMRNRLRHHVMPFILTENHLAAKNAVEVAGRIQEDDDLLDKLTTVNFDRIVAFTAEGLPSVDRKAFTDMHPALQKRMITLLLNYLYDGESIPVEYTNELISQLFHHISEQKGNVSIDLPRGGQFIREYDKLTFSRATKPFEQGTEKVFPEGSWTKWGREVQMYWNKLDELPAEAFADTDEIMYFDLPDSAFPLTIKSRTDGDRILLPGMKHSKRLSRLFIDEKVAMSQRDCWPIITTAQGEICAVPGVRYGVAFSKIKASRNKYIFRLKKL